MKKKIFVIISSALLTLVIVFSNIGFSYAKNNNIDDVLKSKSYSSLSETVKEFIKDYYEEHGVILLTEDLAENGQAYLNPTFIKYLERVDMSKVGVIPSVLAYKTNFASKKNVLKSRNGVVSTPQELPSQFDLRDVNGKNFVTPNKNQGNEGLCWAYATASLLETHDLITKNKSYDSSAVLFSEKQMDYALSSDGIIGGNNVGKLLRELADGYSLSSLESELSKKIIGASSKWGEGVYDKISNNIPLEPSIVFDRANIIYEPSDFIHLLNINHNINDTETNNSVRNIIKNAIYKYGGLVISTDINYGSTIPNMSNENDYITVNNKELTTVYGDHALHMIGWDDDYEYSFCHVTWSNGRKSFGTFEDKNGQRVCSTPSSTDGAIPTVTKMQGKGVWILKNSWGDTFNYIYLTYDSFIADAFAITDYSEKDWDNSYDFFNEVMYNNDLINGEDIVKVKIRWKDDITLYFYPNGNETEPINMGTYHADYDGFHTIDLSTKGYKLNKNSKFKIKDSYDSIYSANLVVFTTNKDNSKNIVTQDFTFSLDDEKPTSEKKLNISVKTHTRGVTDNSEFIYKIKSSSNEYLPSNSYEIIANRSYYNMVTPIIRVNESYAKKGIYTLETYFENHLYSSSKINLEVDYVSIDGSGNDDNPWKITNTRHFNMVRNAPGDYYILMNDLDFEYDTTDSNGLFYNSGNGWQAIDLFYGNFNGNDKKIKNLTTSTGLFDRFIGYDSGYSKCKFKQCGIHNLIIDNITIKSEEDDNNKIGGIINDISLSNVYTYNFNYLKSTDFNINTEKGTVGGIAGNIYIQDYSVDFTNMVLKIDSWYSNGIINYDSSKSQYDSYANVGGVIGELDTNGQTTFVSLNNIKSDVSFDFSKAKGEFKISDFIGMTITRKANVVLNNLVGKSQFVSNDKANSSLNAFVAENLCINCQMKINGAKSTLPYNADNQISIINYEANLKPYELARANYDNSAYYEDDYYVYDQEYATNWKVEFKDKFNIYDDKIPTLKKYPENYSNYYKNYYIRVGETKNISDLVSKNTNYRKFHVYSSFECNFELCNSITDESIITVPAEDNDFAFKGLKIGSTTLIIYDEISGYLDKVTINVVGNDEYSLMHKLILDSNDDTFLTETVYIKTGSAYGNLPNLERFGYVFLGWYTDRENGTKIESDTIFDENVDITIYAHWKKVYQVSFNSNGGNYIPFQTIISGGKATNPNNPTKNGFTFKGWQLNGKTYDFNTPVTSDIQLVALWKFNYSITFFTDGGSEVPIQEVADGDYAIKPADPTKDGYTFKGWRLGGKTYDFNTPVTNYIILYAMWDINKYTVTFDSNGGSSVASQTINYNETAKKPSTPNKIGYTFKEWQLNGKTFDFNTPITNNITLKAVWAANQYTVTFNSDGGSSVASQTINYNETAKKPSNPTKNGYTFKEWQLNEKTFDFNTPITNNITLKAVWAANQYTVTFNSDGGNSVASQIINYNETAKKPSTPNKIGYTFKEWQLNGKTFDFNTPITSSITLIAIWDINKYTVTFNSNGGSSVANQTINYNEKITKPSNPTKNGYTFKEWQLNGKTFDFNTAIASNITLTAVWEKIEENTLKKILEEDGHKVENTYTSKFTLGESISSLKNKLGSDVTIESKETVISTGTIIKKGKESYTVVIKGDLTGDGKVNSGDLLQMRKHLLEEVNLKGAFKEAGIIESNNEIKSLDLLRLRQYLLGEYVFK